MAGTADIKVGYRCNNRCVHCVIADQRERARTLRGNVDCSLEELHAQLTDARRRGLSTVVLTGGEPTIRRDFLELLHRARTMGFEVFVQTNGRMLSSRPFAERVAALGATFVVAMHGADASTHDAIVAASGAFAQTVAGIRNARACGLRVIGKTVISRRNADALPAIAGLFRSLGVTSMNIAFPHGLGAAREAFAELVPRYRDIAESIHRTIERHAPGATILFETVPYCFMRGLERHVAEWGDGPSRGPIVSKQLDLEERDWRDARIEQKRKFPRCAECAHDPICEGVWSEYADAYGGEEFVPVPAASPG